MYVIGINFESTIFTTAWYFLLHFINTHSNMKLTFNTCSTYPNLFELSEKNSASQHE
jgi:hypothetical protein